MKNQENMIPSQEKILSIKIDPDMYVSDVGINRQWFKITDQQLL